MLVRGEAGYLIGFRNGAATPTALADVIGQSKPLPAEFLAGRHDATIIFEFAEFRKGVSVFQHVLFPTDGSTGVSAGRRRSCPLGQSCKSVST